MSDMVGPAPLPIVLACVSSWMTKWVQPKCPWLPVLGGGLCLRDEVKGPVPSLCCRGGSAHSRQVALI